MCLTAEALFLFLSVLPPEIVEVSDTRITVAAETREAVWLAKEDEWCTSAPQIDAAIRLKKGEAL
ncbi:hypothetical protein KUV62_10400 [Salipiger bermudensis]|uniref:hypothetical protein n=1 Tax=Salipiger bermudensis TaxID=344736 RepID=UPI001C997D8F|nr:hypothetical protein [Salipiger bermudensis]MBY6004321.1 hypothetical protein [Salipiger bermudensis]